MLKSDKVNHRILIIFTHREISMNKFLKITQCTPSEGDDNDIV